MTAADSGFGLMAGSVGAGFAVGSASIGIFGLPRRKSIALITCSTIWTVGFRSVRLFA